MQEQPANAWAQPFTFEGAAAFGQASLSRLLAFQLVVAFMAAAATICFFELAWVPVLKRTIVALPASGQIEQGTLNWKPATPIRTAGTSFLWISVDPTDSLEAREGADLQLELGRTELRCRSLLGFLVLPYPPDYTIALNRTELEPWWGAWHLAVTASLGAGMVLWLFVTWAALATLYAWPIRLIAFYADRRVSWMGAWQVAAASLLPGALFVILVILAYTLHRANLVQLLAALALHLMIGWVYVLFAPFCLPGVDSGSDAAAQPGNPFGGQR